MKYLELKHATFIAIYFILAAQISFCHTMPACFIYAAVKFITNYFNFSSKFCPKND